MVSLPGGPVAPDDVSVVVCTYTHDRLDALRTSVKSVLAQTPTAHELIVCVDNNADLAALLRSEDIGARVIDHRGRAGLSGARNTAVAAATGAVVAFLDDDAEAHEGWLAGLCAEYDRPGVVGVGGEILPAWVAGRPRFMPPEFDWVVGCTYRGMPETVATVRNVIGANMSFRRALFDEVGGFDAELGRVGSRPVGCEETEFCVRVRQRWPEAEFIYTPQARVSHLVPASRGHWRYFFSRCYSEGLSKAVLARMRGSGPGLSSERSYVLRTLPSGARQHLADFLTGADTAGIARVAAMAGGLITTMSGYAVGRVAAPGR